MRVHKHQVNYVQGSMPTFYCAKPCSTKEEWIRALHIAYPQDTLWRREAEDNITRNCGLMTTSIPIIEL